MNNTITLLIALASLPSFAQDPERFTIEQNRKYQYRVLDQYGVPVTKFIYDDISTISGSSEWVIDGDRSHFYFDHDHSLTDTYFVCYLDTRVSMVNGYGQVVFRPEWDDINQLATGLFKLERDELFYIANSRGEILNAKGYTDVGDLSGGFADVRIGDFSGLIDSTGREIVPCRFSAVFESDYARYGYIEVDSAGKRGFYQPGKGFLIGCTYERIARTSDPAVFIVYLDGKSGLLNTATGASLPCEYTSIYDRRDGFFDLRKNDLGGLTDTRCKIIHPCTVYGLYYKVMPGKNLYVSTNDKSYNSDSSTYALYSPDGEVLIEPGKYTLQPEVTEGIIEGTRISDGEKLFFDYLTGAVKEVPGYFNYPGYSRTRLSETVLMISESVGDSYDHRYFLIDNSGNKTSRIYEYLSPVDGSNLLYASASGKKGIISPTDEVIIPFEYKRIQPLENNFFLCSQDGAQYIYSASGKKNAMPVTAFHLPTKKARYVAVKSGGKWGILSTAGYTIAVPCKYSSIIEFDANHFVVQQNDRYGIITHADSVIIPCQYTSQESLLQVAYEHPALQQKTSHVLQRKNSVYGFDISDDGKKILTYDSRWITLWDIQSGLETGHLLFDDTPEFGVDYMQIEEVGFVDEMRFFIRYYVSGGGGTSLHIFSLNDFKSEQYVDMTADQGLSDYVQYFIQHPVKKNTWVAGYDQGSHSTIHEVNATGGKWKTVYTGMLEKDVSTYRVNSGAKTSKTHFAYYDQIGEKLWVHSFSDYAAVISIPSASRPHFALTENGILVATKDKLLRYDTQTGKVTQNFNKDISAGISEITAVAPGKVLLAYLNGTVEIMDIHSGETIHSAILPGNEPATHVRISGKTIFILTGEDVLMSMSSNLEILEVFNKQLAKMPYNSPYKYRNFNDRLFSFQSDSCIYSFDLGQMTFKKSTPVISLENFNKITNLRLDLEHPFTLRYEYDGKKITLDLSASIPDFDRGYTGEWISWSIVPGTETVLLVYDHLALFADLQTQVITHIKPPGDSNFDLDYKNFSAYSPSARYAILKAEGSGSNSSLNFIDLLTKEIVHQFEYPGYFDDYDLDNHLFFLSDSTIRFFDLDLKFIENSVLKLDHLNYGWDALGEEAVHYFTIPNKTNKDHFYNYANGYELYRTGSKVATFYLYENLDWIIVLPDNFYCTSPGFRSGLVFLANRQLYPFEQFDLKFNRPDIVLERLGYADSTLVNAYHQAYLRRLKKLEFTEEMLQDEFHLPVISIEEFERIPPITNSDTLRLNLDMNDSKYPLDRINVWVNDVAIFGVEGISLRSQNVLRYQTMLSVPLAYGQNKIQVSVLNGAGVESYKTTLELESTAGKSNPDLYLVTIGVSKYSDTHYNLTYASKDALDISQTLKASDAFTHVFTKTLVDEQVTLENLASLESFLSAAGINDQVIIFVAGHGVLDADFNYYFASHDMDFQNPSARGIPYEAIEGLLDGIKPLKKLLFMDTCHSGEVDKDEIQVSENQSNSENDIVFRNVGVVVENKENQLGLQNTSELMRSMFTDLRKGTGATVISSAGGIEFAMESDEWQNGLFTFCLINGLTSRAADTNGDNQITVSEIQLYVQNEVTRLSGGRQRPTSRIRNDEMDYRIW